MSLRDTFGPSGCSQGTWSSATHQVCDTCLLGLLQPGSEVTPLTLGVKVRPVAWPLCCTC